MEDDFSEDIQWIQWYEFTGSFGGTLWVLLINIGLFEVFKNHPVSPKNTVWVKKMSPWFIGIAIPIVISLILFERENNPIPDTEVLLLQPNIDPYSEKYDKENDYYFDLLIDMTTDQITDEPYIYSVYFSADLVPDGSNPLHRKIDSLEKSKISWLAVQSGVYFRQTPTPQQICRMGSGWILTRL